MDVLGYGLAGRALAGVRQLLGSIHKRNRLRIGFLHLPENPIKRTIISLFS